MSSMSVRNSVTARLLPRFIRHDAFDPCGIAVLFDEELMHAALPGADICYELLQIFDASAGKGDDGLVGSGDDIDHFAIVDVVWIAGDFFEQLEILADPLGDIIYHADAGISRHQAA